MQMQLDQQEQNPPPEPFEITLEDSILQSKLVNKIFKATLEDLFENYKSVFTNREVLEGLKKELSKLRNQARQSFFVSLWGKIKIGFNEVKEQRLPLLKLKQSGFFDVLLFFDKKLIKFVNLGEEIYRSLYELMLDTSDYQDFAYLFRCLYKIGKYFEAKDDLPYFASSLFKQIKQKPLMPQFNIKVYRKFLVLQVTEEQTQQQIILELTLARYLLSHGSPQLRIPEEEYSKIAQVVKRKPYKKVLFHLIEQDRSKRMCKSIFECDFKVVDGKPVYDFHHCSLHKDLQTRQVYLKVLNFMDDRAIGELKVENFIVEGNQIFCKLDSKAIISIGDDNKIQLLDYSREVMSQQADLIKFFLANQNATIAKDKSKMEEQNSEETVNDYLFAVFETFSKYFVVQDRRQIEPEIISEKLNVPFMNSLLQKSFKLLSTEGQKAVLFAQDILKVLLNLFFKVQYAEAAVGTSQTSKLAMKVLIEIKQLSFNWKSLKKIKSLLDLWGERDFDQVPHITEILKKFFDSYFDQRLKIKAKNFFRMEISSRSLYSNALCLIAGAKIKQVLQKNQQKLSKKDLSDQQIINVNESLYKICCILLSKAKIGESEAIADAMWRIYSQYGHLLPFIHHLRAWILHYSNISKNGQCLVRVTQLNEKVTAEIRIFEESFKNFGNAQLLTTFNNNNDQCFVSQFIYRMRLLSNVLELKEDKNAFGSNLWSSLFMNLQVYSQTIHEIEKRISAKLLETNEESQKIIGRLEELQISTQNSIFDEALLVEEKNAFALRFIICNMEKLVEIKDQICLIQSASNLIKQLKNIEKINENSLRLINDVFAFGMMIFESHLEKSQIFSLSSYREGIDHKSFFMVRQDYLPINFVSILYSNLRSIFPQIVKNLLKTASREQTNNLSLTIQLRKAKLTIADLILKGKKQFKDGSLRIESEMILKSIVLPSINVFGHCYWNGKIEQKGKQEQAFGILLDQFVRLLQLNSKQIAALNNQILLFLDVCKDKARKVISQASTNQRNAPRRGLNNFRRDQAILGIVQMGYTQQVAELALDNCGDIGLDGVLEWIDENFGMLEQLITAKLIEKSKNESQQNNKKVETEKNLELNLISYDKFKQTVNSNTKKIIKSIVPELFTEVGEKAKDLIFVCLDSFNDENYKNKQFKLFSQKMFKQLEELGQKFSANTITVIVSCLEAIILKKPEVIKQIHDKKVPQKLLSLFGSCDQKLRAKVLSLVNKTLPVPNQKISSTFKNYLCFILEKLIEHNVLLDSEPELLSKIAKTKSQQINQKLLTVLVHNIQQGSWKSKIFSIVCVLFESDETFSSANIEFDLKSFIIENYSNTNEKLIKLDSKKFCSAFVKYEENPYISEVLKRLCVKRHGKIGFQIQKHDLFKSQYLNCSYLNYELPLIQKTIINTLVRLIVNQKDDLSRVSYIRELYKTLQFYKMLIPFCLTIPINGQTFFEWLIFTQFQRTRGEIICFLTFLLVRNGLFLNSDETLSDYLTAKFLMKFSSNVETRDNPWTKFLFIYLLHIKAFNEKASYPISLQNQISVAKILSSELQTQYPLNYTLNSQALYIILKKELIDALSTKYRIQTAEQFTLQKQFLNMDLFYSRKKAFTSSTIADGGQVQLRTSRGERINLYNILNQLDGEGGLEHDDEVINAFRRMLSRNSGRDFVGGLQGNMNAQNILVPLQPPFQQQQQQVEQQGQQIKQEKVAIEQQKDQNKIQQQPSGIICLSNTLAKFQQIIYAETIHSEVCQKNFIPATFDSLTSQDLQNGQFSFTLKQQRISLDQKFQKTNIFKQRMSELAKLIDPNEKFIVGEQKRLLKQRERERERQRGREGDSGHPIEGEGLRTYMINRMMQRDNRRDPRSDSGQTFNLNRVLSNINQYQQLVQVETQNEQVKQQNQVQGHPQIQQSAQQLHQYPVQIQSQEAEVPRIENQQLPSQMIEQNQQIPQDQVIHEDVLRMARVQQQQQPGNQHQIEQQVNAQNQQIMIEEPVGPHRQILAMMGLSQTFLRDFGVDEETFDCLPEDMQIEQLNVLMTQQHQAIAQQNRNNENTQNNPNPLTQADSQNQAAAFIESLDPQVRVQTLLQATPQFLMALPAAMRAEAENYRYRQIREIQEEQMMIQREEERARIQPPKSLVYPDMKIQDFPEIDQGTAEKLSKSITFKFNSKFRMESLRILLQNLHTQQKALNTIICYMRNADNLEITECTPNKQKKTLSTQCVSLGGTARKHFISQILNEIEDHLTNCIYKDKTFLQGKANFEQYSKYQFKPGKELYADQQGYYPLLELVDICIENNQSSLLTKLMTKVTRLPKVLRKKVLKSIRDDKFKDDFYLSLGGLSDCQKFKQAFQKQFSEEKPIKIETLSKLLKYNFSKLPYIKKLHIETLTKYKGIPPKQTYDFLNQIFSSYAVEDIKQIENLLLQHKQTHFSIIRYLYQKGKSLETQPIGVILKFPHLLDFETKRFIFQKNPKLFRNRHRCVIEVNRLKLFEDSYNQIMNKRNKIIEGNLKIVFVGEGAEDAGGPKKQWFLSLSKQIFDPRYALFMPSSSGNTYQPNPKSYVNAEHLGYFKFMGIFFAKALVEGMLIDAYFTRSFYKMILGHQLQFKDLSQQDYNFYKTMLWFKQNKLESDDQYTFSYEHDYFGKIVTKELIPGGQNIQVTEENKMDYIHKYTMAIMRDSVGVQIQKFLEGFYEVLPKDMISFFEASQLELLMSGLPTIDLKDLRLNTDYQGYSPHDQTIVWFWQILEEYTGEDLAKLIQFITGTSKIPLQGFGKLQGMHGAQKISIHKDSHIDQLPKSHTCFNQFDLPNYPTKEMLKQKLRVIITWGSESFGFM